MDQTDQIAHDFSPYICVYKDGRIDRFVGTDFVAPSIDPNGVSSKDVVILPESGVAARLYLPKLTDPDKKLPILVYFHGGAFCIGTPFCSTYHSFLISLVSVANVVAVSVDYRLAPEHPLPTAYDDSWAALNWVTSHAAGGSEAWLAQHGDFNRIILAGDSAGGNITHNMLLRAGSSELGHGVKAHSAILIHPYFSGPDPIGNEIVQPSMKEVGDGLWKFVCPSTTGLDDSRFNPTAIGAPSLLGLGCTRVLVCVAEKDLWRDRGFLYYDKLCSSGWEGVGEMLETKGEDHVFFLFNPTSEKAEKLTSRLAGFMNFDTITL